MASATNYIRYSSKQGSFDANRHLVDIEIPADSGSYDLSKTYIDLVVKPIHTDATAIALPVVGGPGVFDGSIGYNEDAANGDYAKVVHPTTAVLVKSAEAVASRKGRMASCRNVNVLRSNMGIYKKAEAAREDDHCSFSHSRGSENFVLGNLSELSGEGSEESKENKHGLKIYLSDVFNFAQSQSYDSSKFGALRIHLDLELSKLVWKDHAAGVDGGELSLLRNAYGDAARGAFGSFLGRANNDPAVTSLISTTVYDSMKDQPFWVGEKLTVSSVTPSGGATAITNVVVKISRITRLTTGANKGRIQLNFDCSALIPAMGAAEAIASFLVAVVSPSASVVSVQKIDLVATQIEGSGDDGLQYTEWALQEDNVPAGTSEVQKTYQIPPNVINAMICFPSPVYSHDAFTAYRVAINNEPLTTKQVEEGSSLHREMIKRTFMNMGVPLRDTNEALVSVDRGSEESDANRFKSAKSIFFPVPLSSSPQLMDLELFTTASGKINIFFETLKSI